MSEPHRIRLRGHWHIERLPDGREVHTRHFGRPRTLGENETVWLVCDCVPTAAVVRVNEETLGSVEAGQSFAFDVSSRLSSRNEVVVEYTTTPKGTVGMVVIEIRTTCSG